jgi:hypothetical protein
MRYNRISADCHLDLIWLPPNLFASEDPQALKERMPCVADGPDGPRWVAKEGAPSAWPAASAPPGRST